MKLPLNDSSQFALPVETISASEVMIAVRVSWFFMSYVTPIKLKHHSYHLKP